MTGFTTKFPKSTKSHLGRIPWARHLSVASDVLEVSIHADVGLVLPVSLPGNSRVRSARNAGILARERWVRRP